MSGKTDGVIALGAHKDGDSAPTNHWIGRFHINGKNAYLLNVMLEEAGEPTDEQVLAAIVENLLPAYLGALKLKDLNYLRLGEIDAKDKKSIQREIAYSADCHYSLNDRFPNRVKTLGGSASKSTVLLEGILQSVDLKPNNPKMFFPDVGITAVVLEPLSEADTLKSRFGQQSLEEDCGL